MDYEASWKMLVFFLNLTCKVRPGSDVVSEPCCARELGSDTAVARRLSQSVILARGIVLAQPIIHCRTAVA